MISAQHLSRRRHVTIARGLEHVVARGHRELEAPLAIADIDRKRRPDRQNRRARHHETGVVDDDALDNPGHRRDVNKLTGCR